MPRVSGSLNLTNQQSIAENKITNTLRQAVQIVNSLNYQTMTG